MPGWHRERQRDRLHERATIQDRHDFDFRGIRFGVVSINDFTEPLHSQLAGFDIRVINDSDFATGFSEHADQGFTGQLSALQVVCGDVADDGAIRAIVSDVVGEDRNAGFVGFANGGADAFGVAGVEHNGGNALSDKVFDLCGLFVDILFAVDEDNIIAQFGGFGCHGISDDAKEGIGECECGEANFLFAAVVAVLPEGPGAGTSAPLF